MADAEDSNGQTHLFFVFCFFFFLFDSSVRESAMEDAEDSEWTNTSNLDVFMGGVYMYICVWYVYLCLYDYILLYVCPQDIYSICIYVCGTHMYICVCVYVYVSTRLYSTMCPKAYVSSGHIVIYSNMCPIYILLGTQV